MKCSFGETTFVFNEEKPQYNYLSVLLRKCACIMAMLINTVYILLRDLHYPVDMVVLEDAIKEWMITLMKISIIEDFSTTAIIPCSQ